MPGLRALKYLATLPLKGVIAHHDDQERILNLIHQFLLKLLHIERRLEPWFVRSGTIFLESHPRGLSSTF